MEVVQVRSFDKRTTQSSSNKLNLEIISNKNTRFLSSSNFLLFFLHSSMPMYDRWRLTLLKHNVDTTMPNHWAIHWTIYDIRLPLDLIRTDVISLFYALTLRVAPLVLDNNTSKLGLSGALISLWTCKVKSNSVSIYFTWKSFWLTFVIITIKV